MNGIEYVPEEEWKELTQKNRVPLNKPLDYISRQVAVEAIENTDWYHINQNGELVSGANSQEHEPLYKASEIYAALEEVPSADVVEVVHCKDCKYYDDTPHFAYCVQNTKYVDDDGFCSDGERRADG